VRPSRRHHFQAHPSADTAPSHLLNEFADPDAEDPLLGAGQKRQIQSRETDYQKRRFDRDTGEAARLDPFAPPADGETGDASSYAEAMRRRNIEREEQRVARAIEDKAKEEREQAKEEGKQIAAVDETPRRKRRWDVGAPEDDAVVPASAMTDVTNQTKSTGEWDEAAPPKKRKSRWDDATPAASTMSLDDKPVAVAETPRRSRWDQTPVAGAVTQKPAMSVAQLTPMDIAALDKSNRPLSDEELDLLLPTEGYEIVDPPAGYAPIRRMNTPASGFMMQDDMTMAGLAGIAQPDLSTEIEGVGQLAFFKQEDAQYFAKILKGEADDEGLTTEELKERKIMRLLLKIKNGCGPAMQSIVSCWLTSAQYPSHAQVGAAPDHRQGARLWRGTAL
jgi:splicing factor 3B subunit 1